MEFQLIDYHTHSWMTGPIFRNLLQELNKAMEKQKRKIALILDNWAAYRKDAADDLPNIKLIFLSANVTSLIQPCDMGIIRNLKANYRRKIVRHIIHQIDTTSNITATTLAQSVTLLDGMHMLKTAWQEVKTTSIINCFRKAGFELTTIDMQEPDNSQSNPEGMTEAEFEE